MTVLVLVLASMPMDLQELLELQKQKQWPELLARGLSVLPSQRNQAWKDAVETAMFEELGRVSRAPKAYDAMPDTSEAFVRYVHLAESKRVREARGKLAAKAWDDCLSDGIDADGCAAAMVSWSRTAPLPGAMLTGAAEKLLPRERPARSALAAEALRVEPSAVRCDAEWLTDALPSGAKADVDAVVAGCGARLGRPVVVQLLDTPAGLERYCPKLLASGLEGTQRARCERRGK